TNSGFTKLNGRKTIREPWQCQVQRNCVQAQSIRGRSIPYASRMIYTSSLAATAWLKRRSGPYTLKAEELYDAGRSRHTFQPSARESAARIANHAKSICRVAR